MVCTASVEMRARSTVWSVEMCARPYMPSRRTPSGLGTTARMRSVRVSSSSVREIKSICPWALSPGRLLIVSRTCCPSSTLAMSRS